MAPPRGKPKVDLPVFKPDLPPATEETDAEDFVPLQLEDREVLTSKLPSSPLELFESFLPHQLLEKWVAYYETLRQDGPSPDSVDFRPTSVAEMYCFLAIVIYMGIHPESSLSGYWAGDHQHPKHPISTYMSIRRFEALQSNFVSWEPYDDKTTTVSWPYSRIEEVSQTVREASKRYLEQVPLNLMVDESLAKYKNRRTWERIRKGKIVPIGSKVWSIGYRGYTLDWVWDFDDFTPIGQKAQQIPENSPSDVLDLKGLNDIQKVIVTLVKRLPAQPYHLFFNDLFTSPNLLLYLREHMGVGCTAEASRTSGIHQELVDTQATDRRKDEEPRGYLLRKATPDGKVQQLAWKDDRISLFMSTVYTGLEPSITQNTAPYMDLGTAKANANAAGKEKSQSEVVPPLFVNAYNMQESSVGYADQLRSNDRYDHKKGMGPHRKCLLLRFILDVALTNSFLLQHWCPDEARAWEKVKDPVVWKDIIIQAILREYGVASKAGVKGYPSRNALKRPNSEHTPIRRGKNGHCKACQGVTFNSLNRKVLGELNPSPQKKSEGMKRSQTRYGCAECDVALCNSDKCWYFWHQT